MKSMGGMESAKGMEKKPSTDRKYNCRIVKEPDYDVYRVKAGNAYNIIFTFKNSGEYDWPESINLVCTNGVHKGSEEKMPSLPSGKEFIVNLPL